MSSAGASKQLTGTVYPVQYLRVAAALVVMLFHISVLSQETWELDPAQVDYVGAAGVDLFFVISGFIMAMIVARSGDRFSARDFWLRRIARVVPAYWVITLFVFMLALVLPSLFNSTTASVPHLLASLSFLAVDSGSGHTGPLLVVGWTLNYEMFFYLVVALTAGLLGDESLSKTSAVLCGLVAFGLVFQPAHQTLMFYSDPILLEFVFGIMVFRAWRKSDGAAFGVLSWFAFVLGMALLAVQWERPLTDWRMFFWGIPAMAVLYGGLGVLRFSSPVLARLGDWSYALYLTHVFVITFYIKFAISAVYGYDVPWPVHYLALIAICTLVSAVFYTVVERPLSGWVLRRLKGQAGIPERSHPRIERRRAT
ncbi:acyltransferase family protein [Hoeflea sp.]|uniref:acyltransferase family protein n=1 Tax=Hoeflea sp. TaxID=1940281 RepID=UPI003B526283